jgi:hypothetical protein
VRSLPVVLSVTSKGKSLADGQTKFTASMVKGIERLRASLEPDVCLLQEVDVATGCMETNRLREFAHSGGHKSARSRCYTP